MAGDASPFGADLAACVGDERVFSSEADFVAWLSLQSDRSLDGRSLGDPHLFDNQRVSRAPA